MKRCGWALLVFILSFSQAFALEFQPIGARQLGMGGTGVASTMDVLAQYYNPAIFGFYGREEKAVYKDRDFGINIQAGAGLRLNKTLAENIDGLAALDYDGISNIGKASSAIPAKSFQDATKLLAYLKKIDLEGGGLTLNVNALAAARIKRLGIGVYGIGEALGQPKLDLVNVGLTTTANAATARTNIANAVSAESTAVNPATSSYFGAHLGTLQTFLTGASVGFSANQANQILNSAATHLNQAGIPAGDAANAVNLVGNSVAASFSGQTIDKNTSSINAVGAGILEVPLTYGHPLGDSWAVGVSLKYLQARVYETSIPIFKEDAEDIARKLDRDYKESSSFAVDAGLFFHPTKWFKAGVVGKYLNTPEFDRKTGDKYKIKPQARAGVALTPFRTLTFAADMDLTSNETALADYKSQNVSAGLEWDILRFLALRVGAYKNLAERDIDLMVTAGLGLNLYLLRFDLAGAISTNQGKFRDKSFPNEARVQANISIEF